MSSSPGLGTMNGKARGASDPGPSAERPDPGVDSGPARSSARAVREALADLPCTLREPLALQYLSDLPSQQAAEILRTSEAVLRDRTERALAAVGRRLASGGEPMPMDRTKEALRGLPAPAVSPELAASAEHLATTGHLAPVPLRRGRRRNGRMRESFQSLRARKSIQHSGARNWTVLAAAVIAAACILLVLTTRA